MEEVSELSEMLRLRLIVHPKTQRDPVKISEIVEETKNPESEDPPTSQTPKPGAWKISPGGKYDDYLEDEDEKVDDENCEEDVNANQRNSSKRAVHFVEVPVATESPLKKLRENLADYLGVARNAFMMMYRGMLLEDEDSIDSTGLEENATVHIFPAVQSSARNHSSPMPSASRVPPPPPQTPSPPMDAQRIARLSFALQSAFVYPRFHRQMVQNMLKGEKLENIIAATPGLRDDREAIALLRDPLCILAMSEVEALKAVWKRHFRLIEALENLAGSMHADPNSSSLGRAGVANRRGEDAGGDLDPLSDEDVAGALMDEDEEEADDESGASGGQQDMDAAPPPSQSEGAVGGGARPRQGASRGRRNQSPAGGAAGSSGNRGQRRRRPRSDSDGRGAGHSATRQRTMQPGSSPRSQAGITQEALAAALRSITGSGGDGAASSSGSSASSSSFPPPRQQGSQGEHQGQNRLALPEQRITTQMFQDALNRAMSGPGEGSTSGTSTNPSSSPSPAMQSTRESTPATASESSSSMPPPPPPGASSGASRFPPVTPEREAQVRMLEELGFFNPAENLQALEATNGDVSAAVGLILNLRES